MKKRTVLIDYPSNQEYTVKSLVTQFRNLLPDWRVATCRSQLVVNQDEDDNRSDGSTVVPDLQWCDYDAIDWDEAILPGRLVNSYAIRKSLIRKNHLAHTLDMYLSKHPESPLRKATLKTIYFNLSFADELDELLVDDLYDVSRGFEEGEGRPKWWILKPALADKGNGIRLFSTRDQLEAIFEEFDLSDDDDDDEESSDEEDNTTQRNGFGDSTRVSSSQMREWVVQEYVATPLLIDPNHAKRDTMPRKFHLRVYVVAVGGLTVYVHRPFLALFAPTAYALPSDDAHSDEGIDLSSHLTNTCLQQSDNGEDDDDGIAVRTLQDLDEHAILAGPHRGELLGKDRIAQIEGQVDETVAETFKAGVSAGSGFQVLPGSFEIFGFDFLVDGDLQTYLLEINACPDFTQTGSDLQSVIDTLFNATIKVAVIPFFDRLDQTSETSMSKSLGRLNLKDDDNEGNLRKVLDMQVNKSW